MFSSSRRCMARSSGPTVAPSNRSSAVFSSVEKPSRAHEMAFTSSWRLMTQ
jgi:hypothetical protein